MTLIFIIFITGSNELWAKTHGCSLHLKCYLLALCTNVQVLLKYCVGKVIYKDTILLSVTKIRIVFKCKSDATLPEGMWLSELISCITPEKITCCLRNKSQTFFNIWKLFLNFRKNSWRSRLIVSLYCLPVLRMFDNMILEVRCCSVSLHVLFSYIILLSLWMVSVWFSFEFLYCLVDFVLSLVGYMFAFEKAKQNIPK